MAKYLVTSGSYFEPFTYEQLSAPVREMAEMHRASQDTYDQISLEAEALRRYIEREPDNSEARKMYDSYMDKLTNLQNNLWSNGYNAQTRRDLSAARAGYASDISRLGTAIQTRQQRSAEYWKTRHDHPDMIMGNDPGLASLDSYLADDLYGQNYYAYSGNDFMNQVGASAKAMASEMLNDPEISRDPRAVGYLKRIKKDGFTNLEVQQASDAIDRYLAGDASAIATLDGPQSILANVLLSGLTSTGAEPGKNVSNEEYRRLVEYGKQGLKQAVGKADVDYMKDLEWQANEDRAIARYKKDLENPQPDVPTFDSYTRPIVGSQTDKEIRRTGRVLGLNNVFGGEKKYEHQVSELGNDVYDSVDASQLVYSEELAMEAYKVLGFDIGLNPDTNGWKPNTSSSFLQGQSYDDDGNLYDIRYNTRIKKIQTRRAGTHEKWGVNEDLTRYYERARARFENVKNRYKNVDPEIYKMAKVTPEKKAKAYANDNVPFTVPLDKYRDAVMNDASTSIGDYSEFYMTKDSVDKGKYIDMIAGFIAESLPRTKGGALASPSNVKAFEGNAKYIHRLTPDRTVSKDPIKDPNDAFDFEKGAISNINSISLDVPAIREGYIIVNTTKGSFAVGIDMLRSDLLGTSFKNVDKRIRAIEKHPEMYDSIEEQYADINQQIQNLLAGTLSQINGQITESRSGTSSKDTNFQN